MALRTKHVPNNHFFPTAYIAVSGGSFCPCEEAASALKWPRAVCRERRFKIFDLDVGAIGRSTSNSEVPMMQAVYSSLKGLVRIHNPSLLITLEVTDPTVRNALKMAAGSSVDGTTILVVLPRSAVPKVLWMADLRPTALPNWNKMRISVNIITQNRATSLKRLLDSLERAFYVGDEVPISFNMDSRVDEATLKMVGSFNWTRGPKVIRRRIIQGGLIRAVSESWYPSSDDDFGLLLEDDIEVSPYYYRRWPRDGDLPRPRPLRRPRGVPLLLRLPLICGLDLADAAEIRFSEIRKDARSIIPFDEFGFTHAGVLELNVSKITFSNPSPDLDLSQLDFFLSTRDAWIHIQGC